jgi:hypothetical protein
MGTPVNTDIKHKILDQGEDWNITQDVKNSPITILDNVMARNYFPVFDGLYFRNSKYSALCISTNWELGGGAEEAVKKVVSFVTRPDSTLFLPTVIVNSVFASMTDIVLRGAVIKIINKLKKSDPRRRVRLAYYSKDGRLSNYEYPSFASLKEIEKGMKKIPMYSLHSKHDSYFVYDTKRNRWIKE